MGSKTKYEVVAPSATKYEVAPPQVVPQEVLDNLRQTSVAPPEPPKEGFWGGLGHTLVNTVKGIALPAGVQPGGYPSIQYAGQGKGFTDNPALDPKQVAAQEAQAADQHRVATGRSLPYRAVAAIGSPVADVEGMERAADAGDTAGVVGHAVGSAAPIIAGEALHQTAPIISDAIPSKARAEGNFQAVMGKAGKIPIDTSTVGNIALDMKDKAGRGGRLPKVVNDFIKNSTDPNAQPINYEAGRDYYSNAGELSVEEKNALKPKVKRQLVQFNKALGEANEAAADSAGVGDQYRSAMKEYRRAKQIENVKEGAKDIAIGAVKHAIPIGVGGYAAKKIIDDLR